MTEKKQTKQDLEIYGSLSVIWYHWWLFSFLAMALNLFSVLSLCNKLNEVHQNTWWSFALHLNKIEMCVGHNFSKHLKLYDHSFILILCQFYESCHEYFQL